MFRNSAPSPLTCPAQASGIFIKQTGITWCGNVYVTKAGVREDLLVLEKPDLGVQNLAFSYKQHQTNPLHKGIMSCLLKIEYMSGMKQTFLCQMHLHVQSSKTKISFASCVSFCHCEETP